MFSNMEQEEIRWCGTLAIMRVSSAISKRIKNLKKFEKKVLTLFLGRSTIVTKIDKVLLEGVVFMEA